MTRIFFDRNFCAGKSYFPPKHRGDPYKKIVLLLFYFLKTIKNYEDNKFINP